MKKRTLVIVSILAALAVLSVLIYIIFFKEDKNTTLTIAEKQWIEKNKNNVSDVGILNEVFLLNYDGEGVFFDFVKDLEEDTNLVFNKVSYQGDTKNDYALVRKNKVEDNDILFYKDEYVLVTKDKVKYLTLDELNGFEIGVLEEDLEDANSYLRADISFKSFSSLIDLITEINMEDTKLNGIVMTKLDYLKNYNTENASYISYNITEMSDYYVLTLGKEEKLNTIFKKYFEKWQKEQYQQSYNLHITNNYFLVNDINNQAQVKFRSKRYVYGYVENLPYDIYLNDKNYGINSTIISNFANQANIEIVYEKYEDYEKLSKAFKENKIDFFFDSYADTEYDMDIYNTISPIEEDVVILSNLSNEITVNSIRSLKNKEVLTVSSSAIEKYLLDNKIKVKSYKTVSDLITKVKDDSIIALNYANYNYYVRKELDKFKID